MFASVGRQSARAATTQRKNAPDVFGRIFVHIAFETLFACNDVKLALRTLCLSSSFSFAGRMIFCVRKLAMPMAIFVLNSDASVLKIISSALIFVMIQTGCEREGNEKRFEE
jgi:hypothetical protein